MATKLATGGFLRDQIIEAAIKWRELDKNHHIGSPTSEEYESINNLRKLLDKFSTSFFQDDCYFHLEPDEEYFCLIARDIDFNGRVRSWCIDRTMQIENGARKDNLEERAQISSALEIARRGRHWRDNWLLKKERANLQFDDDGYPTTGPNRRRITTTSGEEIKNVK